MQKPFVLFFLVLTVIGVHTSASAQVPADVPANIATWHAGDGDTRDFTGMSEAHIVFPRTNFVVGKSGQALGFNAVYLQGGGGVRIDSGSIFRGRTEGTIETWVRLRGLPFGRYGFSAIWSETEQFQHQNIRFGILYNRDGQLAAYSNFATAAAITPTAVPQNEWLHVAAVHKAGEPLRLYVNGVLAATSSTVGAAFTDAPSRLVSIGYLATGDGDDFSLIGDVDEASTYTRALSAAEISSIYNAGTAGKARSVATAAGSNVSVLVRDATVTFANVSAAGMTSQTPLDPATLPPLPQGFAHTGLAYDISTTASYSGDVNLCFNLPALAGTGFPRLRILHLENGSWVNRTTSTTSPQLCGPVTSLSPFVIADITDPAAGRQLRAEAGSAGPGMPLPVNIKVDANGDESAYEFVLNYDPAKLTDPVIGAGTSGAAVRSCDTSVAGQISCSVSGFPNDTNGNGTREISPGLNRLLLTVTFTVENNPPAPNGPTPLTLTNVSGTNDLGEQIQVGSADGSAVIFGPLAAEISISGKVTNASGYPIRGAYVTVQGGGVTRTVLTSQFGFYRVSGLEAGETYTLMVAAKRYTFANPIRTYTATDNLTGVDFIAQP